MMALAQFDHLVMAANDLDTGAAYVAERLGAEPSGGGKHVTLGTHNKLWRLGAIYLEVIAIDPEAERPARPRWFALDALQQSERPRLMTWVARTQALAVVLSNEMHPVVHVHSFSRGPYRWLFTLAAADGLSEGGLVPPLIEWQTAHPLEAMPDSGCGLKTFEGWHPEPVKVRAVLAPLGLESALTVHTGETPRLRAVIQTPKGEVVFES
ncbi:MAG: VOC family protein [Anaerolineales bacterium]|nr:VOC family protein [Anaerolineales bacterium]